MGDNIVAHDVMHRKPFPGIANGCRRYLAERHGAVSLQGGDPGVGGGRHNRTQQTNRHAAVVFLYETLDACVFRPPAQAADRHNLVLLGQVDHDRRDAGKLHHIAMDNAQCHSCRNPGIDRVAAGFQDVESSLGRQKMTGGHHVSGAIDHRLVGHDIGSFLE